MADTPARLLALLSLLQSRPYWSAPELSERMGVTARTVRRDVTRLRDLGYPVEATSGPYGGYQLGAGGRLPPLLLSDDEAVAVVLGLEAAAFGTVSGLEDSALAALAKLGQVMPGPLRQRVADLHETTVRLPGPDRPRVDAESLVLLARACRSQERLRMGYRDAQDQPSDRVIEPFRLVFTERRWYLVARDTGRDDWRTFRVDRITALAETGQRFTLTDRPDAAAMVANGIAVGAYPIQARVALVASIEEAAGVVSRTVGRLESAVGGGCILTIGASDPQWIAEYLAGLPFEFEVLDPPAVRKAVRDLGRRIARRHAGATARAGAS
jgi:predicted DNA-binding transcriptional regulator YafY